MKIFKAAAVAFSVAAAACGVKGPPVPRDALNIPVPYAVFLSLKDDGVLVSNGDGEYPVLVEKAARREALLTDDFYSRVGTVNPGQTLLDTKVTPGVTYTYKFRNYSAEYGAYSAPSTRTIAYSRPVQLSDFKVVQYADSACADIVPSSSVAYVTLSVNGHDLGRAEDNRSCFPLPNSLTVTILAVPYDENGNAGIPREETLKRDENMVLLPPQNARALRQEGKIILSWDKAANVDGYAVYLIDPNGGRKTEKTDITLYQYPIKSGEGCVDFELSSLRGDAESDRVRITSCP